MLEKIDLSQKISKKTYKQIMPELADRLYRAQKASWDAEIPVVILFEGWDAAGKGTSIQKLTSPLDPRGFKLYPIRAARTYEKKHPWLWRFWLKLPARGEWAIFDRSWYGRIMVERVEELIPENEWRRAFRDIVDFERTLADDGHLIIKFFLHISKQEQKKRFDKLVKDPLNAWHVSAEDWEHHRRYDDWTLAYEEAFERTDSEWGPWTIVEATDRRFTWVKIYQTVIDAIEQRLKETAPELLASPETEQAGEPAAEEPASLETEAVVEQAWIVQTAEHVETVPDTLAGNETTVSQEAVQEDVLPQISQDSQPADVAEASPDEPTSDEAPLDEAPLDEVQEAMDGEELDAEELDVEVLELPADPNPNEPAGTYQDETQE